MILLFPVGLLVDGITRVNDYTMTTPPSASPKYPWLVYCQMIGQLLNLWASDGAIHSTKKGSSLSLSLWKKMYRSSCGETCRNNFDDVVFFFLWGVFCMSKVLYFFYFSTSALLLPAFLYSFLGSALLFYIQLSIFDLQPSYQHNNDLTSLCSFGDCLSIVSPLTLFR